VAQASPVVSKSPKHPAAEGGEHSRKAMDGVVDLPMEPDDERRSHLLQAATELYVSRSGHDQGEQRIYVELFRQLLPDTPPELRLSIAGLVANYPETPVACLEQLVADPSVPVAALALASPRPLSAVALIGCAARGPERIRACVARRAELEPSVVVALIRHAAPDTVTTLLARKDVALDEDGLVAVLGRADLLPGLAAPLARQHVLPARLLFALFLDLDEGGRMEALAAAETRALADLVRKGDHSIPNAAFKPAVLKSLVDAALAGGAAAFAAHLAYVLDLDGETAARIVEDPGGEALMVALKAVGTSETETGRIAVRLLGQRLRLDRLRLLLALHDRMTPRAAFHLMRGLAAGVAAALEAEAREAAAAAREQFREAAGERSGERAGARHVSLFEGQPRSEGREAARTAPLQPARRDRDAG
jgi:uncharacterized protein (DUF2336 family)